MYNLLAMSDALREPPAGPRGCTSLKLRRLSRLASRLYDAKLAACGLKTTQYSLLACIDKLGPVQPAQLARTLSMDPSTLTRNLRPLATAGWVRVQPGPDSRSRSIVCTEAGHAKRTQARVQWLRAQRELNRVLGPRRVAALHALIDDARARLQAYTPEQDRNER